MPQKIVLITGASVGIGKMIARVLLDAGHRVFGTSRNPKADLLDGIEMLQLDVTDDASVQRCVDALLDQAGHLDVLVNNAGVDLTGAAEEFSIDEVKWLFETNFFGVIRMTNAVLPHFRARRSGQIINIGSAAGRVAIPFQSTYTASKHALKGYSESLMHEVEPLGIRVALIEPGFYRSAISHSQGLAEQQIDDYADMRQRVVQMFAHHIETAPEPVPVALAVRSVVEGHATQLYHPMGLEAIMGYMKPFAPESLWKHNVRWVYRLNRRDHPLLAAMMSWLYRAWGRTPRS